MPPPGALAVVQAAVSLTRGHAYTPALDVLDLVMGGHAEDVRAGNQAHLRDYVARLL